MIAYTPCCRRVAAALMLVLGFAPAWGESGTAGRVRLPGTGYEVVLEAGEGRDPMPPSPALIAAISDWLSSTLELPMAAQPPNFRFAAAEQMIEVRHRAIASDHVADVTIGSNAMDVSEMADILAVYDDESRTIFLRENWSGRSAAGLSIVVHEMVHHMQNVAGLKFECYEAREKQAFAAQEEWLALFGKDLVSEFGLDPFTLLVRTNCPP